MSAKENAWLRKVRLLLLGSGRRKMEVGIEWSGCGISGEFGSKTVK